MDTVRDVVVHRAADQKDVRVYLALAEGLGTTDRGPVLTGLWDELKDAGLDIAFIGKPAER